MFGIPMGEYGDGGGDDNDDDDAAMAVLDCRIGSTVG
jgi:hypothetical protein